MRKGNTMGQYEYLSCHLYWAWIAIIAYRRYLFMPLSGWSERNSLILFCVLMGIGVGLGILLTRRRRRNYGSVLVNVMLPAQLYTFAAGGDGAVAACLIGAAGAALWLAWVLHCNRGTEKAALRHALLGGRTVFAWVFALCCIPGLLTGGQEAPSTVQTAQMAEPVSRQELMDSSRPTLRQFRTADWSRLTREEKLEALQAVVDMEAARLGLPDKLELRTDSLRESVMACYVDAHREIRVNEARLDTAEPLRLVESVCHETYHAYQFRLCDAWRTAAPQYRNLPCFENAAVFAEEFANYISGAEDFDAYYSLACETTARSYAREAVEEYLFYISHLG